MSLSQNLHYGGLTRREQLDWDFLEGSEKGVVPSPIRPRSISPASPISSSPLRPQPFLVQYRCGGRRPRRRDQTLLWPPGSTRHTRSPLALSSTAPILNPTSPGAAAAHSDPTAAPNPLSAASHQSPPAASVVSIVVGLRVPRGLARALVFPTLLIVVCTLRLMRAMRTVGFRHSLSTRARAIQIQFRKICLGVCSRCYFCGDESILEHLDLAIHGFGLDLIHRNTMVPLVTAVLIKSKLIESCKFSMLLPYSLMLGGDE
ncbi:hypothetical protein BS78_05G135700 [Paspalum vaginatum]|nr:hypothetical protein BS78_05G135700 [Paspalum vaginatum]